MRHFDLVVIGTGSSATSVAYPCRSAGRTVAIIDSRPFGGTCANRGCDPKKVLVGVADLMDLARRMQGKGFAASNAHIDWPELMRFKKTFTDPVPANREEEFKNSGIEAFHGTACFTAEDQLAVGDDTLTAQHFVIASGAAPAPLGIPGEDKIIISDDFLDLESLPKRIAFVGGGYIAFEFAHLSARAGSKVTILHRGKRPLEQFDADITDQLLAHTRRIGIDVQLNTPVESISGVGDELMVHSSGGRTFPADLVVHAAGRSPNVKDLNLAAANVESSRKGVAVNEFLQSVSNPRVYAVGDAAASGGPPLTPVAGYDGRVVATNLLHGNSEKPNYSGVASAVFTIPPMASVGLTEEAAKAQNFAYDVNLQDTTSWYSSMRLAEESSGCKVLIEKKTGRLLGAHIFGDRAEELINIFSLAIRHNLTSDQVRSALYSYPSHGSNIQYML
jgi:glutathione reductase (NADPH)